MNKKSAVILAAGNSVFEGLQENISKCVAQLPLEGGQGYVTPITATINALLSRGIYDFHIVVGYAKDSVIEDCNRLIRIYGDNKIKLTYVETDKWDKKYIDKSIYLGVTSAVKSGAKEIYILEGDTLVAPEFIGRLIDVPMNATLIKNSNVFECRSDEVELLAHEIYGKITSFTLDKTTDIEGIGDENLYYSGHVWKILISSVPDKSYNEDDECDYYFINNIAYNHGFMPVFVDENEGLYNINTKHDYEKVKLIFS